MSVRINHLWISREICLCIQEECIHHPSCRGSVDYYDDAIYNTWVAVFAMERDSMAG